MKAIGARLRHMRQLGHWSDCALAANIGISATELRKIESGEADPRLSTILALADVLGVQVAWLVGEVS